MFCGRARKYVEDSRYRRRQGFCRKHQKICESLHSGSRGGEPLEIAPFSDGVNFFAAERILYDIVYIGCVMAKIDGMRVAKKIREYDRETAIVFAAENINYAINGYEVSAADFLKKPVTFAAFSKGLDRIIENLHKSENILSIKAKRGYARIAARKVDYVEKDKNYIVYHTYTGDIRERGIIGEKKDELALYGFSRINSGCLVNLLFVSRVDGEFVFIGNKMLPISRSCKDGFYDDLEKFMKNQIRL